MFLAGVDITLKRFRDITNICGHIPRPCFAAALSPDALLSATREILDAIDETKNLADTIAKVHNGRPIHRAFEIFPSPESRRWINCLIRPVSDWAFSQMLAELDRQGADAAYRFYRAIQGSRWSGGNSIKSCSSCCIACKDGWNRMSYEQEMTTRTESTSQTSPNTSPQPLRPATH
jgi:hypothetical protein